MKYLLPWEEIDSDTLSPFIRAEKNTKVFIRKELNKIYTDFYDIIVHIPYGNQYVHTWRGVSHFNTAEEAMLDLDACLEELRKYYFIKKDEVERFKKLKTLL